MQFIFNLTYINLIRMAYKIGHTFLYHSWPVSNNVYKVICNLFINKDTNNTYDEQCRSS